MKNVIRQFLRLEASGGIILIIAAVIAMGMANSPLRDLYQSFLDIPITFRISTLDISKSLLLWVNDGLMAIFFLLVGLEVKRELIEGSLAGRDKALFPAIAALGGMLAPAIIYLLFNGSDELTRQGWAIPAATDIAFALGVMALLGDRVPNSLKVFLLALAIIDDLGVIIIIALFYTANLSWLAFGIAVVATVFLACMNWRGVDKTSLYLLIGFILWVSILKSGIHATLAGVLIGFMIPLRTKKKHSPLEKLEHGLHPWVAYLILPLFAFANAGVSLSGVSFSGLTSLLPLGIATALIIGKPLGIFIFSWISVKTGIAKLPNSIHFKHIFSVSVLCGIGFTMSIFIASLAFDSSHLELNTYSKLGILLGSTVSAVLGYSLLKVFLPKKH
ncbi:Na(+)/H(+) antiporter NhaA [Candidatus Williamhamiltonella defendens]|uniref:Na(+)/H(+) antiporter NhaA n=1 Tax=Candidatus Williamhamiltonella defendens TaxID=138072 RepID=A0A2D3T058_9ENTR|nr:Na+/H+ antiporter NhaA [Candidatus Hamiltonella defensa]ATW29195.1 Na(+)/H(+) antiporter NhaA [Candidatus Hamiltonella defensa]ATW31175.1 Na(+)/H(+) antiporter NhaA [Candidatus Hamiltonella defensa]